MIQLFDSYLEIYIHSSDRFDRGHNEYPSMIDEWNDSFVASCKLSDSLCLLSSENDRYSTRKCKDERIKKIGVCFEYLSPDNEEIYERLYYAYIALWSHSTAKKYQQWIVDSFDKEVIANLPKVLEECEHTSLLWDDMSMLLDLKKEYEKGRYNG